MGKACRHNTCGDAYCVGGEPFGKSKLYWLSGSNPHSWHKIRHLSARLVVSFLLGGLLMWLASNVAMLFEGALPIAIPAGALTGILGAPLIIC